MKKDMENMTNKVSFITKIKNLSFSEPLTVKIPIIIISKTKRGLFYLIYQTQ